MSFERSFQFFPLLSYFRVDSITAYELKGGWDQARSMRLRHQVSNRVPKSSFASDLINGHSIPAVINFYSILNSETRDFTCGFAEGRQLHHVSAPPKRKASTLIF